MRKPLLFLNFNTLGIGCLFSGALSSFALADSDENPGPHSREPLLRPIKVVSTTGNVSNAEALVADAQGYTSLTMVQGGTAPMIILDYGHDVGGLPVFEVAFPVRQSCRRSTANRSRTCCPLAMAPPHFRTLPATPPASIPIP